ncbi:MAG: RluA family pseudouridine synthase [Planctomycetota bacterium]
MIEVTLGPNDGGPRADRVLRKLLPNAPLALLHRLLRQGKVRSGKTRLRAQDAVDGGSAIEVGITPEQFLEFRAEAQAAAGPRRSLPRVPVVFEDEHLLVVDKPAGLAVQPGTARESVHLLAWIEGHCPPETDSLTGFRPAPAHRIDRPTSGLVVIGKTSAALRALTAAFRDGTIRKTYLAVVEGRWAGRRGTIELALETKDRGPGPSRARVALDGKPARTHWTLRSHGAGRSLLEIKLETGRTHQIRAHVAALGHPIVGDRRYGSRDNSARLGERIALHAAELEFAHPIDGTVLTLHAELPADLRSLLDDRRDPH